MKTSRKFLALLLCLTMVMSLLSGAFVVGAEGEPAEGMTFTKATALTAGNYYVVVTQSGGKYYALAESEGKLTAKEVAVSDNKIVTDDSAVMWKPDGSDHLESVSNEGQFIFAGSGGFILYDSSMQRVFLYDDATGKVKLYTKYELTFDGTKFDKGDIGTGCTVELYSAPMPNLFSESTALEAGKYYMVVTESDGKYYALAEADGKPTAKEVTVENNQIYTADASVVWKPDGSDHLESVSNEGQFIFAGSGGFILYDSSMQRVFLYDDATGKVKLYTKYELTFDGTKFDKGDIGTGCTVKLYATNYFKAEEAEPEEPITYKAASELKTGKHYVIVTASGGRYYALVDNKGSPKSSVEVQIENGTVTTSDKKIVWATQGGDTIQNVGTGKYIYAGSGGFMVYSSGRTFVYDAATGTVKLHNGAYALTFADDAFDESADQTAACKVMLFEYTPFDPVRLDKTDSLESNSYYMLAVKDDDKYYALDAEFNATEIAEFDASNASDTYVISDDTNVYTVTNDTNLIWLTGADDGSVFKSLATDGFLYPLNGHLDYSVVKGRSFSYDPTSQTLTAETPFGKYAITYADGAFAFAPAGTADARFTLFRTAAPEQEATAVITPNTVDTVTRTASTHEDGSVTLAFSSDVHYDGKHNNLAVWLPLAEAEYDSFDAMGFCGDMGSAYLSGTDYWQAAQDMMEYMDGDEKVTDAIYTTGNHEWFPTAGGDYANNLTLPVAKRIMQVGEALRTDKYIFYSFGAGQISMTFTYDYDVSDIETLDAYLSTAPDDIPIFILTHFPIHWWESRYVSHASDLIEVLNKHSDKNLVVLWGHNHSDKDANYFTISHPGDTLTINPDGETRQITFDYMSAGTTADAEYTGPEAGSAWTLNKGLIVTIKADGSLKYDYITIDGTIIKENGPTVVSFRTNTGDWEVFESKHVEIGQTVAAPEAPEIDGYKFVEWDYDFTKPISQPTLVTAKYEEIIDKREITVTPTATANGNAFTMTANGLNQKITVFDLASIGYGTGIEYGFWFTHDGTFSFSEPVTLFFQGDEKVTLEANKVYSIAEGINGESFSEMYVQLDDGNMLMILDTDNPGNFDSQRPDTAITDFPGTVVLPEDPPTNPGGGGGSASYTVTVNAAENGTVAANRKSASTGSTVTLTVTPNAGYQLDKLTVLDKNGEEIAVTDLGTGKFSFQMPNGKVSVSATFKAVEPDEPADEPATEPTAAADKFSDVNSGDWFEAPIDFCLKEGLMIGVSETEFGVSNTTNRAMIATILHRIALKQELGSDGDGTYQLTYGDAADIPEYALEPIAWVTEQGIMGGYDTGDFGPVDPITREQFAVTLFRFAKLLGLDVSVGEDISLLSFGDAEYVSDWAVAAMQWVVGEGVMIGDQNANLNPGATATRAEVATMLQRFCAVLEK